MKVFDFNNFQQNINSIGNAIGAKNQVEKEISTPSPNIVKSKSLNYRTGTFLNGSDTDLIKGHLEKYIHTDSLRLEMQLERLEDTYKNTQKELNALSLLPPSDIKFNQQRILLAKRQQESELIKNYKEQYKQLSPVHHFAMWLKEKMKDTGKIKDGFKSIMFGKQAGYIDNLKKANNSLQLLVDQASTLQIIPGSETTDSNIVEIMKQFNVIETGINKETQDRNDKKGPGIIYKLTKAFQKNYYGYELQDKPVSEDKKMELRSLNIDSKLL